jgi:hypothetical protein
VRDTISTFTSPSLMNADTTSIRFKPNSNQAHRQEVNASVILAVGTVGWLHAASVPLRAPSYTPTTGTFVTFKIHGKPFTRWFRKYYVCKKLKCWAETKTQSGIDMGCDRLRFQTPNIRTNTHADFSSINPFQPRSRQRKQ